MWNWKYFVKYSGYFPHSDWTISSGTSGWFSLSIGGYPCELQPARVVPTYKGHHPGGYYTGEGKTIEGVPEVGVETTKVIDCPPAAPLKGLLTWLNGGCYHFFTRSPLIRMYLLIPVYDRGEPAVSYKWTGWVWEITGWNSRLQENYRSFHRNL